MHRRLGRRCCEMHADLGGMESVRNGFKKRHERLGILEYLYKQAQARLERATKDLAGWSSSPRDRETVAGRLGISVDELELFRKKLTGIEKLTAAERELFQRVARLALRKPAAEGASGGRPDIVPERSGALVYVTTSGGSVVFHVRPDCPALQRGQAAAATMGKDVWPLESMPQSLAEAKVHSPCATCVPGIGSAELLRPPTGPASSPKETSAPIRSGSPAQEREKSKTELKRERDRVQAENLGITVEELKTRRREEHERAIARRLRRGG